MCGMCGLFFCKPREIYMRVLTCLSRYQPDIGADGVFYLADADELVGGMAAARLAWSQLQRGGRHEGLVAQGG